MTWKTAATLGVAFALSAAPALAHPQREPRPAPYAPGPAPGEVRLPANFFAGSGGVGPQSLGAPVWSATYVYVRPGFVPRSAPVQAPRFMSGGRRR